MDLIAFLSQHGTKIKNTAKVLGNFVISQSDKMSEAHQRHLGRGAQVEIFKEYMSKQIEINGDIKKVLLERYKYY